MELNKQHSDFEIPVRIIEKWQDMVDIIAELIGIPAAMIVRVVKSDFKVVVSSYNDCNPYQAGDHEHLLGAGLYCETVINTKNKLLVPNSLKDEKWKNNPDIKLNMISYLGFPILRPDGKAFGTICVLDNKENAYSETYEKLIVQFRDIIENNLELIYMNLILGGESKQLTDYISEIKTLRGLSQFAVFI